MILDRAWGRPESSAEVQALAGGNILEQLATAAMALREKREQPAPALPAPAGTIIDAEPVDDGKNDGSEADLIGKVQ